MRYTAGTYNLPRLKVGIGKFFLQARSEDGVTTYKINAMASPDSLAKAVIDNTVADTSSLLDWFPYLRLVVSGPGEVSIYLAETVD